MCYMSWHCKMTAAIKHSGVRRQLHTCVLEYFWGDILTVYWPTIKLRFKIRNVDIICQRLFWIWPSSLGSAYFLDFNMKSTNSSLKLLLQMKVRKWHWLGGQLRELNVLSDDVKWHGYPVWMPRWLSLCHVFCCCFFPISRQSRFEQSRGAFVLMRGSIRAKIEQFEIKQLEE